MTDPVNDLRLPRLPMEQAGWLEMQAWWQRVVEQIEATVSAINSSIQDVTEALDAAVAAQASADAAQDAAISAASDAAAAQTTANGVALDLGTKVSKDFGPAWAAPTGTASRATFATYTAPTVSITPTQAEMQALADHVQILSRLAKALVDDGRANHSLTP